MRLLSIIDKFCINSFHEWERIIIIYNIDFIKNYLNICSPFAAILYSWQKFWISSSLDNASAMISIGFIFWKIRNFCNLKHYCFIKKAFNLTHVIIIVFARAEKGSFPDFSAVIKIRYWCTILKKALIFNDSSISEFRKKFFH